MARIPGGGRPRPTPSPSPSPSPNRGDTDGPGRHPAGTGGLSDGGAFQRDVETGRRCTSEVPNHVDNVVNIINGILDVISWFPGLGGIVDLIRERVQEMFAQAQKMADKVAEVFAFVGDPSGLREMGLFWVTGVGEPSLDATTGIKLENMPTAGAWRGDPYDAYVAKAAPQQPAAQEVHARTVMIENQLNTFAAAIEAFWIAFAIAALALIGEIIAGIAMIAGIYTSPPGVLEVVMAIIGFITAVIDMITPFIDANNAAAAMMSEVTASITNGAAFVGGNWPPGPGSSF
ncbi:hypothetical protein [Homoserinibacter sp. YIM 151385]|uniref:hypothetical protein n=1 Tax=Homoserinibacter sp. YIM 151385 TaxID=2985506 RepID=UPI0022F0E411|nr:hypothetical protein [Homoserinibacter sp. YIM 151385]WBU38696.1 hypothetical protein OF852_03675 [Homoserinibacter sp. YIM 151385]